MAATPSAVRETELSSPLAASPPVREPILIGAVLAITALVYIPTIGFPFVYDDHTQIVENQLVQHWRYVPGYFRGYVWQYLLPKPAPNYYRPLNFVWFRINDAIFGLHPAAWHAATILLHLAATYLAYRAARSLTRRPLVAATAALLFGIHPMRHEVVAWISGATESLWSVFFFAAFLAYLISREKRRGLWMGISCLCYAVGLLCKESAIVLPAIVFAHAWLYDSDSRTAARGFLHGAVQAARPALWYVPLAAVYIAIRIRILGAFSQPVEPFSWRTIAFSVPSALWFYVHQWLLPVRISEFYPFDLRTKFDLMHTLLPILILAAIGVALWLFRNALGAREVIFSGVWMIVTLLPALDLVVFPLGQTVHDRYFYVPSFGACLLVGLILAKFSERASTTSLPRPWLAANAALLALLIFATVRIDATWAGDYAMLSHAALFTPDDPIFRSYYGMELERQGRLALQHGDLPSAESLLQRSLQADGRIAATHFELGLVELQTKRVEQAETRFREAVSLGPNEPTFHFFLGVALSQQSKCAEAGAQFSDALALRPALAQLRPQMDGCAKAARSASAAAANHTAAEAGAR